MVCSAACAPECTAPPTLDRPLSSESCGDDREFIRRGGEWWRFGDRHGWTRDRRITLSAQALGAHALVGMPEATRVPVRRVAITGRTAVFTGILIRLGALGDKWSQEWGRSSERQRQWWDERDERGQAPQRAAHLVVRSQRLVQGRAGPSSQPPRPSVGRQPHLHRHLTGTPLAGRREPPRADPADPVGAVLRAVRMCRLRRGPRIARHPPVTLRDRRRPALDGSADGGPAQRVLAQRPDAGAARLPRELAGPGAGWCPRPRPRTTTPSRPRPRPAAAGCPGRSWTCWSRRR